METWSVSSDKQMGDSRTQGSTRPVQNKYMGSSQQKLIVDSLVVHFFHQSRVYFVSDKISSHILKQKEAF